MRANDIEGKIMALLTKAKVFKRKNGKRVGFHTVSDRLDKMVFDPSFDSPHICKIRELLVEMAKCPDARSMGYPPILRAHDELNIVNHPPE